jgi:hypothetical protein
MGAYSQRFPTYARGINAALYQEIPDEHLLAPCKDGDYIMMLGSVRNAMTTAFQNQY